ncbi:MAG TPA: threonine synthase [bacterium]
MQYMKSLKCRECGKEYPLKDFHVCEYCFGPLEVAYDYQKIARAVSRNKIEKRHNNMWRYREFLPIAGDPTVGVSVGFTPLIKARALADALGVKELYIKNDGVSYPTLSFKDRVVSVALTRAKELNFSIAACASTGNLANSVAANAAASGMDSYIFIPWDLEQAKILGTVIYGAKLIGIKGSYDKVNRLCSEIAGKYGWAFVNINIRPYYAEGSKTFAFEIAEQLGWRSPAHIVVPMAGGSLITKICKAFKELKTTGLISDNIPKIYGAQATGCSPITSAIKEGKELFKPVIPNTIAKSLAIGNPADGYYAIKTMKESGGTGEDVSDDEIVESIKLLAKTEGIFTETAGGVTLGVLKKLLEQKKIPRDESIVLSITGNGLKTMDAVMNSLKSPVTIEARIQEFDEIMKKNIFD